MAVPRSRRPQPWALYLGGAGLLLALYLTVPPLKGSAPVMNVLGLSPVVAILAGLRMHRPEARGPWRWFAAGFALFWLGDVYTYSYWKLFHADVPFPSPGDALYVLVYPVLIAGLVSLIRRRSRRVDVTGTLDAAIMTVGLALFSWIGLIAPSVHDVTLDLLPKLVSIAYPVGDILLLAAAIRLTIGADRRHAAFGLMVTAIVALLVTDFAYGLATLHGTYDHQLGFDVGWVAFYVLWGAAALHPSMRELHRPAPGHGRVTRGRLAALTAATLIAPVLELVELPDHRVDLPVIIGASIVMFGFVVVRMTGLVREVQRRSSEARLSALVEQGSDLVMAIDADGVVVYQSPSVERVLGYPADAFVGRRLDHLAEQPERLAPLLEPPPPGESRTVELEVTHRDGTKLTLEVAKTNLLEDEHVRALVLNARDVSERRAFERQLEHQAFHDPVTGLANRALFVERVRHAVARSHRDGQGFAVLFLDLDDFKTINDSLGHAAGDQVLAAVGERLAGAVRAADLVARFGGDEFAVLLEDTGSAQAAADSAERLVAALAAPLRPADRELVVRASIGVSVAAPGAGADEVVRDADAAMYIAKRERPGSYRIFEPAMHEGVVARLELRADLERAIVAGDELELFYQPVVRLGDEQPAGLEALLRWRHPQRGLVGPDAFIPLAEDTGLIVEIGRWVLMEACRRSRELQLAVPHEPPLGMSVNLSVVQLQRGDVVADVRDALAASGIDPALLTLEITETAMMTDAEVAVARLHELKALGVRLAMDDFGTGHSSLSYLSRLPVDVLKMDRSFLRQGAAAPDSGLAAAVVALARSLSLSVVAEGIEHPEQASALRELACDLGQGFHFARPMDAAATRQWLLERSSSSASSPPSSSTGTPSFSALASLEPGDSPATR